MPRRSADINVMVRAAERAGRALIRDFGEVDNLQVSKKGPGDFVSAADLKAEDMNFGTLFCMACWSLNLSKLPRSTFPSIATPCNPSPVVPSGTDCFSDWVYALKAASNS